MRVTNNMRQDQVLRNLQANLQAMTQAQEQVSTGKRFTRASEDPIGAAQVMRADRDLRGIEQYRRNSTAVRTRLDAEESVLDQVTDLLTRAKELGLSQSTATATAQTRTATAAEVDRILEQVINLGNTKVGTTSIFGGHRIDQPPFLADGTYAGDDGQRPAEISAGYVIDTNHTGRELFVDSGVIRSLQALRDQLRTGDTATIGTATNAVTSAFSVVQTRLAEVGARSRQLENAGTNLDALASSLELRKDADQGISLEAATTSLLAIQNSLQAAYASAGKVMTMSLTDYLR